MPNDTTLKKIMAISPHVEMVIRRLYRSGLFHSILPAGVGKTKGKKLVGLVDFEKIIHYLKRIGISQGDILIVHSAYKPLKATGLNPQEIINSLLKLIGPTGTLVMPVIRHYDYSNDNAIIEYDLQKTKIWTGALPIALMTMEGSVTSRFPLNPITAHGEHAKSMIQYELDESLPAPNGKNSAWYYCLTMNAKVISLGTDLTHSLTMIHTAEDSQQDKWPISNWYVKRKFKIKDNDFELDKEVLERDPKWGMLHFAERTLCKDLIKSGIMKTEIIEGVIIESLESGKLIKYLNKRNHKGYPYFWIKKHLK